MKDIKNVVASIVANEDVLKLDDITRNQTLMEEYNELVKQEYERLEKQKQFKNCVHCNKKIYKYGIKICSKCFRNTQRWGSDYGKPININHILALSEMLINGGFEPNKDLVDLVKTLRTQTCNNQEVNYSLAKDPLNPKEYTMSLIVAFYFMYNRNIIESGTQFKSYIVYLLINKSYLRDSLKKRMKLYDNFENQGLILQLIKEYDRFQKFLDGRDLKRYYEKGNYSPYENI